MTNKKILFLFFFTTNFLFSEEKNEYDNIQKLEKQSSLYQSSILSKKYSGKKNQWNYPYGIPQPKKVCELASVWFTSYSLSTITAKNKSVLETLKDKQLWDILEEIGFEGIDTGPIKISGDVIKTSSSAGLEPTGLNIAPQIGTKKQYLQMVEEAKNHNAIIIGNIIPGHTGLGPDFILALKNYKDYPGIYHMVEIDEKDWHLLPQVKNNELSANLDSRTVYILKKRGYIVGPLEQTIFYQPQHKISNWDATKIIEGVDKKKRRWVYLHYFKKTQPTLNWLDPSFAANRLIAGNIIQCLTTFKNSIIGIDSNKFLGIEISPTTKKAWSEAHPLAICTTDTLAMLARKFGGYTYQNLNLSLNDIKIASELGTDLSYDFVTRTAYCNALINQDASFLRLVYRLINSYNLPLYIFIHSLQNNNEINYELAHFEDYPKSQLLYKNKNISGRKLSDIIRNNDLKKISAPNITYNLTSETGICTTMVGLCAAALGIKDVYSMTNKEKEDVKKAHLLLTFFNVMQPGVIAISGWDLVGALPLKASSVKNFIKDGDNNWVNRGSYDLLGKNQSIKFSSAGLPKAKTLYGPLPKQLKNPSSYASQLKKMLNIRKAYNISLATQAFIPSVKNEQVFISFFKLPGTENLQMTAINFGRTEVEEKISLEEIEDTNAINIIETISEDKDFHSKNFTVKLKSLESKAILFRPKASGS